MTIELAAPALAVCAAATERELRAFFAARTKTVFRDAHHDEWSANVSCQREHRSDHAQSWKCTFEHLPVGAYPDYQVVGASAVPDAITEEPRAAMLLGAESQHR